MSLDYYREIGRELVAVEEARLAEIAATNSCDRFALEKPQGIRAPFSFRGGQWITTGSCYYGGGVEYAEAYRVVVPSAFRGLFSKKPLSPDSEEARKWGSYHGRATKAQGKDVMLQGPPLIFTTQSAINKLQQEEPPTMTEPCNTGDATEPPGEAPKADRASLEHAGLGRRCVECLGPVDTSRDERKMFCSDAHRTAFHNRQTVRGRKAMPLLIAERITRGGDRRYPRAAVGIAARKRARALIALWVAEDKAAGRMAMDEYVELRMRLGLTD